jgi:hypothetical protein
MMRQTSRATPEAACASWCILAAMAAKLSGAGGRLGSGMAADDTERGLGHKGRNVIFASNRRRTRIDAAAGGSGA